MVNSGKASGADFIGINNVESDNNNVHDHGNYGNGGTKPILFAYIVKEQTNKRTVKIFVLSNDQIINDADVTISLVEIKEVSNRFANTLYGYFIGKRLAFPIVENYVKNTWAKYGIERVMLHNGVFFFQFSTQEEINIVSLQNSFDAPMEKDKFFEVNNETWKASNDVGSIMDDSDSEKVKNVFVKYNGKPMDGLVDDAQKKVEARPKKSHRNCTNGALLFCLVVPIKVNIMAWRVLLDNLPTRFNLSSRGLEIPSLSCPLCNVSVESTSHIFFSYSLARQLWNKVFRWWDIDALDFLSYDE
ncbi:zinc knuckle CX2CX4HX4C containing protein [Tanacetum coccineum]